MVSGHSGAHGPLSTIQSSQYFISTSANKHGMGFQSPDLQLSIDGIDFNNLAFLSIFVPVGENCELSLIRVNRVH